MDDLISRQAAIDVIEKFSCFGYIEEDADKLLKALNDLSPAHPEIIRCKDCKWHNGEINQCNAQICASMRGEDFCSKGERKAE